MNYIIKGEKLHFKELPFFSRPLDKEELETTLNILPFTLTYKKDYKLLREETDEVIEENLRINYEKGSEILLMNKEGIGEKYANDFLTYIYDILQKTNLQGIHLLEIGSGTGYLLNKLKEAGAEVIGYEPGFKNLGKFNVKVIGKFFPSEEINDKKFDIIISFAVLEHIKTPEEFLINIRKYLKDDGLLFLTVPDCELYINNGDISMMIHEHFSYFTKDSFNYLLLKSGYSILNEKKSNIGGYLYSVLTKNKSITNIALKDEDILMKKFIERFENNLQRLQNYLLQFKDNTIGIYVPLRAMNFLHIIKDFIKENRIKLRFFEDSEVFIGKYLPCFNICIENITSLRQKPPAAVIIFSYYFGHVIKDKLVKSLPESVIISEINEIFR